MVHFFTVETGALLDRRQHVAAGVHILKAGMSVEDVATSLAPYLTTAERIKIAAQSYSSDISCLSVGQDGG
ncbi:hypothetical protein [Arthrobacter bambusae]|uniref:hypothetical protein n=1 Tax=Arthrobacter bambusae TaxID=1338426 RepID=UPI002782F3AE|nr:hypothetical protein [Arthrobacter bambusae]MDQ0212405.1 hypothetical protein [Arthrobacter bambusae]MDQ0236853.1 hypothetical protein [Arthrobacter bambusae]